MGISMKYVCSRPRFDPAWLVAVLLLAILPLAQGQTKLAAPPSKPVSPVILVDTDDECRLTLDDTDQGIIAPAASKKINVSLGDHILKCVVESVPELVWRKVVTVKSTDQVAATVSLKALHVQHDEAVKQAKQKQEQEAAAEKERQDQLAVEEQRRKDAVQQRLYAEAQFSARFFEAVKGNWKGGFHTAAYAGPTVVGVYTNLNSDTTFHAEFSELRSDGDIVATITESYQAQEELKSAYTNVYAVSLKLLQGAGGQGALLRNDGQLQCTKTKGAGEKKGASKDKQGFRECAQLWTEGAVEFRLASSDRLELTGSLNTDSSGPRSEPVILVKQF